jgi:hypothetical protein
MSTEWPTLCDGTHPSEPVRCALLPGPNDTVPGELVTSDTEPGATAQLPDRQVHVHKGTAPDGSTHRWEDTPE